MRNLEIRQRLKECGLKHWELAELLKMSETTLCVKLRKELSENDRIKVLEVINNAAKQREGK